MPIRKAILLLPMLLSACALHRQDDASNELDKSLGAYKKCLEVKEIKKCESLRLIYEADKENYQSATSPHGLVGALTGFSIGTSAASSASQVSEGRIWTENRDGRAYSCNNFGGSINCN